MTITGRIISEPLRVHRGGHSVQAFMMVEEQPVPVICWDELAETMIDAGDHIEVTGHMGMRVTTDGIRYELVAERLDHVAN